RPVLRPLAADARSARGLSAERADLLGPRAHRMWNRRARRFDLAVPVDGPLPVGRKLRADRRNGEGADEFAGPCGRRLPHFNRPVRLLRRACAPRLKPVKAVEKMSALEAIISAPPNPADEVRAFYESHPYPAPLRSLDEHRKLYQNPERRRALSLLMWSTKKPRPGREILVAGCGT